VKLEEKAVLEAKRIRALTRRKFQLLTTDEDAPLVYGTIGDIIAEVDGLF